MPQLGTGLIARAAAMLWGLGLVVSVISAADEKLPGGKNPKKAPTPKAPWVEPQLPNGQASLTVTSEAFLKPLPDMQLKPGVTVATTAPTVDVLIYPGQTYEGRPWSNWGDGTIAHGKFYSAIGDHLSPAGTARVFEEQRVVQLRQLFVREPDFLPQAHADDAGADGVT